MKGAFSLNNPLVGRSVNFEDFFLICTVFPHFGPFLGEGGTKFCGQEFYGHPDKRVPKVLLLGGGGVGGLNLALTSTNTQLILAGPSF